MQNLRAASETDACISRRVYINAYAQIHYSALCTAHAPTRACLDLDTAGTRTQIYIIIPTGVCAHVRALVRVRECARTRMYAVSATRVRSDVIQMHTHTHTHTRTRTHTHTHNRDW